MVPRAEGSPEQNGGYGHEKCLGRPGDLSAPASELPEGLVHPHEHLGMVHARVKPVRGATEAVGKLGDEV